MNGRVGIPGVRRVVVPDVDVVLSDGWRTVVVLGKMPGVVDLVVVAEVAVETAEVPDDSAGIGATVVSGDIVADVAGEMVPDMVEEITLAAADAEVKLPTAEDIIGPAVAVVEEAGCWDVEADDMSGPGADVDCLAAVDGVADSALVTLTEDVEDKEDIVDSEVETVEELVDLTDIVLSVAFGSIF